MLSTVGGDDICTGGTEYQAYVMTVMEATMLVTMFPALVVLAVATSEGLTQGYRVDIKHEERHHEADTCDRQPLTTLETACSSNWATLLQSESLKPRPLPPTPSQRPSTFHGNPHSSQVDNACTTRGAIAVTQKPSTNLDLQIQRACPTSLFFG